MMALLPEDKATRIRCFKNALRNWNYAGYVRFKEPVVTDWLATAFPEFSLREIANQLFEYLDAGGIIDEQPERGRGSDGGFDEHEFHFDLRIQIDGRRIYFETILICENPDDPDDPVIEIVSVHDV